MGNAKVPGSAPEAELQRMMLTYGNQLVGLCTGLLGDHMLAQDVVQETFIKAYKHIDTFRGEREESEKAWLTRIAVNLCRDQQRSRWFRFVDKNVSYDMLPERAAPVAETQLELYHAVTKLPTKYREVILLHYYQDMDAAEIAKLLHVSLSSVYRRLEKARAKLKDQLERWDDQ
ncbi:MAG: sigma-70 family RNA polymerase sigma factor [Clostridia bacterium]|nr:sigma-70 family RNA polymerase sigma factor [Clostridia bacterium]